jgi:hypothetical protein
MYVVSENQKISGILTSLQADVIRTYKPPVNKYVRFILISPGFNKQRFCEDDATFEDQWYSNDVWIWNLNKVKDGEELHMKPTTDKNGIKFMQVSDQDSLETWKTLHWPNVKPTDYNTVHWPDINLDTAWIWRVFHPKIGGHRYIQDAVITALRADKISGVKQI